VGEYDATGQEIKTYGWASDSTWGTNLLFVRIAGIYYWYQNDAQGTPQKIIGTNGSVVWAATYGSFGNCQVDIETIVNNLRFPGQYFDAETGLYYNLQRYYDPTIGRYLRTDPFGQGLSLYVYCFNNPINWMDPRGLCAVNEGLHFVTDWAEFAIREAESFYREKWNQSLEYLKKNYLNWTIFAPDYFSLNINVAIPTPWTGTLFGVSGQVILDRYGNLYWGVGPTAGKALTFASGSVTGGYYMTGYRTEEKLKEFLSGHSFNIGGGSKFGGEIVFNKYGAAYEVGYYTPQFGGGYHYSWQKGRLPIKW
jgi:RHS repeat-associated protein